MKLFMCMECADLVNMVPIVERRCECGRSWGRYIPEKNEKGEYETVVVGGAARVFGINSHSFILAGQGVLATFEGWFYDTGYINTDTILKEEEYNDR